jgi:hypothetical protein
MLREFALSIIIAVSLLVDPFIGRPAKVQKAGPLDGTPTLWREPSDIASRDLYLGPGGAGMKPDLSRVKLIEESGPTKYQVRDGAGRKWVVKTGIDARAETAASRLAWACGYHTDITYLVPRVEVEGKGTLENVRFEARPEGIKRLEEWRWDDNPFVGTPELQGLKVLLAFLDNWNLKNENNKILLVRSDETADTELRYIISDFDFGAARTGGGSLLWDTTNPPGKPARFISGVKNGLVQFNYSGPHKERLSNITVAQVKWTNRLLSRLGERQIQDAFRAGNYSADETRALLVAVSRRIEEMNGMSE